MAEESNLRTSKEFMKALRPPVARYYPIDLHVHSPGSYDACEAGNFESLSPELQECIQAVASRHKYKLPVAGSVDAEKHDRLMCDPAVVECFFRELARRRDAIVTEEGLSPTDNWAVVGITDHNTSHFACSLSEHAWKHRTSDRMVVLPGIELDIQFPVPADGSLCNIHVLCLFAPLTQPSDIRLAVEQSRQSGPAAWTFGSALNVADLPSAISALRSNDSYPAACVAAHVWSSKGVQREPTKHLLASYDAQVARLEGEIERANEDGSTAEAADLQRKLNGLIQDRGGHDGIHLEVLRLIGRCGFDALQVRDRSHESMYRRLHRFRDEHGRATPIVCSDAHLPQRAFACRSGIPFAKLSTSVLSGDSPATLFRELKGRVLRFGETRTTYSVPGAVAEWIEGVEIVAEAEGSSCFWSDDQSLTSVPDGKAGFVLPLSRNLNCLVGGRGCGKSAAVEAIAFLTQEGEFEEEGKKRGAKSDWYSRAAATLKGAFVRLIWKSSGSVGLGKLPKRALLVSRYFDPDGRHDKWEVRDVNGNAIVDDEVKVPRARVLRAHQIEETAKPENLQQLFDDLCGPRIGELSRSVEAIRERLVSQRGEVLLLCEKLAELTAPGSPLRQYGIRKAQFEAVNREELQARFEVVDRAAKAARQSAKAQKDWVALDSIGAVEKVARQVATFFVNAGAELGEAGAVDEVAALRDLLRSSEQSAGESHSEQIAAAAALLVEKLSNFAGALKEQSEGSLAFHRDLMDTLASEGLPTGSIDREQKKKAFEVAGEDLKSYEIWSAQLGQLLDARRELHRQLVLQCKSRTDLRKLRAKELTDQLASDLDAGVLRIEIDAKSIADKAEFEDWLERNFDGAFSRYGSHRRKALLASAVMPADIREALLDAELESVSVLRNAIDSAKDGRIDADDCKAFMTKCRGRLLVPLDESQSWSAEFVSQLPESVRNGLVVYPSRAGEMDLCIDEVLRLDEVVLDDVPEVRLNDRPRDALSEARPLDELSPGQRCSAILPILLLSGSYPLIIDQPEENLDNRLVRQVIVNILASIKLRRQVIIATHNPNLPVLGDVEQCTVLQARGRDLSSVVSAGSLDSASVARYITDIMEGGREAFQYRQSIYQHHWDGPVDGSD